MFTLLPEGSEKVSGMNKDCDAINAVLFLFYANWSSERIIDRILTMTKMVTWVNIFI